jgi:hypothetical protein
MFQHATFISQLLPGGLFAHLRHCLLAAALGGGPACWAQLPPPTPGQLPAGPVTQQERITISGVVLDDSLNVPIPGLWLYIDHTKYGAITNEQGVFTFSFPTGWKLVRSGFLLLRVTPIPFTFKELNMQLDWRRYDPAHPLTLRLASAPERGRPNMHGFILMAAPVPPPVYPARARTARP